MSGKSASPPSQSIKIKSVSRKKKREIDIYSTCIITKSIYIPITKIGKNIEETLKKLVSREIEGKCITEGYIKPESIKLVSYSNGVQISSNVVFDVVISCRVCNPVEGMYITCIAKNITKAGIRAEVEEENNPIVIFIARDHNYLSSTFSKIQENQEIKIRVIGQRFELNDKYISVIGELVEGAKGKSKKAINLESSVEVPTEIVDEELVIGK